MNPETGDLKELQLIPTMPEDYMRIHPLPEFTKEHCDRDEPNTSGMKDPEIFMPSDVHLSFDKRFLYVSNRSMWNKEASGSIASYRVLEDGTLELTDVFRLSGKDPRGFQVSPDDNRLIVGLCDASRIDIYETDPENGTIRKRVDSIDSASPASFIWI